MHALVNHTKSDPAKFDEGVRVVKEKVIPTVKKQAGFKGGYWLFDRKTGKGLAVTLWEGEQAIQSSGGALKQLADEEPGDFQITSERYEVVAQA
jgi:hypothetical protein